MTPGGTSWAADKEHMKAAGMEKGEAPELGVHHESVECQVPLPFLTPSPFIGLSQALFFWPRGFFFQMAKYLRGNKNPWSKKQSFLEGTESLLSRLV